MKILVLGGTQFIGRHLVEALLAHGHAVSTLNRGRSPDPLPAAVERLRGDRDAGASGLQALAGRAWDACIDVSGYTPRQVRPSTQTLRDRVGRYVFVSAVMVYGDPVRRPVTEAHPRVEPAAEHVTEIDGQTYGPLKVACEDIVTQRFGDGATLLRPQTVVGPHDPSGRYAYWAQRALRGGEMLVPGDGTDHVQTIDVRDLARFVVTLVERDLGGSFNLAGPRLDWASFVELLGPREPVWVAAEIIEAANLAFGELPLYRAEHGPRSGLMDVSNERARAAGLTLTDPVATLADVRTWAAVEEWARDAVSMLAPQREAGLIAMARGREPTPVRRSSLATSRRPARRSR